MTGEDQRRATEIFQRLPEMNRGLVKNIEQKFSIVAQQEADFARCVVKKNGMNKLYIGFRAQIS